MLLQLYWRCPMHIRSVPISFQARHARTNCSGLMRTREYRPGCVNYDVAVDDDLSEVTFIFPQDHVYPTGSRSVGGRGSLRLPKCCLVEHSSVLNQVGLFTRFLFIVCRATEFTGWDVVRFVRRWPIGLSCRAELLLWIFPKPFINGPAALRLACTSLLAYNVYLPPRVLHLIVV